MNRAAEKIAEAKIQDALEKGELDNLPGRGQPIDLTDYFKSPPHLRIAYHLLKNSGFTPCEIELLKEIDELRQLRKASTDKLELARLTEKINSKSTHLNVILERSRLQK